VGCGAVWEDAARLFVSCLGYDEPAALSDTYKVDFADWEQIDQNLLGYIAIAEGLGVVRGKEFRPKELLTRAAAAEMIYNYLSF